MFTIITSIPRIMRGLSWNNSARLLDNWFARPATAYPKYAAPDTTTIKLNSWALKFPRVRSVYDKLIQERIWSNQPGRAEVNKMLLRKGLLNPTAGAVSFGSLSGPVDQQDADYINERPAGGYSDFDDVTAALGDFNIRVVVAGTVTLSTTKSMFPIPRHFFDVEISEVGVYIRDSFDFDGNQYLGCWSDNPDGFSPIATEPTMFGPTYIPVGNRDFREWRDQNNRGGDCLIFSDMNRVPVNPPDKFLVQGPPIPT